MKSTISALGSTLAIAAALVAGQIAFTGHALADSATSDGTTANHDNNQLRWLPYRPDPETAAAEPVKTTDCKKSQCAESKTGDAKNSQCKNGDCKCADCTCDDCQCKDGDCKCSQCNKHNTAAKAVHHAQLAFGESASPKSKVRLASADDSDAPVLTDPFEDMKSGEQRHVSISPDDDNAAPLAQAASSPRNVRVSQQAPLELQSGETITPTRELPGRSVRVYQANPTPGPESYQPEPLPDEGSTKRAMQNPSEDCRAAYDKLKGNTLGKVSLDIKVAGQPGNDVPYECSLTTDQFSPRSWQCTTYTWKASALCHKPLYFEDEALERYGHSHGWICEDLASCAHFFGDVALLPYHVGVETPCECIYDLGVYRPGDCAPYIIDPFPISLRGCATAAIGYGAVVALFP